MNDFKAEPAELLQEQMVSVERVLKSGWYILGKEVSAFESEWARHCGSQFAVGVGNGMDAIEIGLRALDIGEGDEVITTPMTAFATVLAIIRAGATPVLADIDPATALLDPNKVLNAMTNRTKAVLLVHLYGQVGDMDRWASLCSKAGVHIVEDCAQAHLARWKGKTAGNFGPFGAYSFYPTKNLGALGDGGALVTNSPDVAARAKVLRNYGQEKRYHHSEYGLNSRLDELQAAILSARLKWLERFTVRRREIAQAYHEGISNPAIRLLSRPQFEENHVYHLFVVLCQERDRLSAYLKERGVESLSHYPVPVHQQPPCRNLPVAVNDLKNAERHAFTCLSLPCHPQMGDNDVKKVIDTINAFE